MASGVSMPVAESPAADSPCESETIHESTVLMLAETLETENMGGNELGLADEAFNNGNTSHNECSVMEVEVSSENVCPVVDVSSDNAAKADHSSNVSTEPLVNGHSSEVLTEQESRNCVARKNVAGVQASECCENKLNLKGDDKAESDDASTDMEIVAEGCDSEREQVAERNGENENQNLRAIKRFPSHNIPENDMCNDVEELLSDLVPKDYVNCVWSNEPFSSGFHCESSQEKAINNLALGNEASVCTEVLKPEPISSEQLHANTADANVGDDPKKVQHNIPQPQIRILSGDENLRTRDMHSSSKLRDSLQLFKTFGTSRAHFKDRSSALCSSESKPPNTGTKKQKVMSIVRKIQPIGPLFIAEVNKRKSTMEGKKQSKTSKSVAEGKIGCSPSVATLVKEVDPSVLYFLNEEEITERLNTAYKQVILTRSVPIYNPPESPRFSNGNMYQCTPCGDKFLLESSLQIHISRKTALITYKCAKCRNMQTFDNRCNLLQHIYDHGQTPDRISPGDLSVAPPSVNEDDPSIHLGANILGLIQCKECGRNVNSVKNHMEGDDTYGLRKSYDSKHRANPALRCSVCKHILPSSCALSAHIRFHEEKPPFVCPECGLLATSHPALIDHMGHCCFVDLERTSFQCGYCKVIYSSSKLLQQHIWNLHIAKLKVYKCNMCAVVCATIEILKAHQDKKHPRADPKDFNSYCTYFICQLCPGKVVHHNLSDSHAAFHCVDSMVVENVVKCGRCKSFLESVDMIPVHRKSCTPEKEENDGTPACEEVSKSPSSSFWPISNSGDVDISQVRSIASFPCENLKEQEQVTPQHEPPECTENIFTGSLPMSFHCTEPSEEIIEEGESSEREVPETQETLKVPILSSMQSNGPSQKQKAGESIICKICKLVIALPGDKVALKKHFISHHQALFLQALHNGKSKGVRIENKVIRKFPFQKASVEQKQSKKVCTKKTLFKKKHSVNLAKKVKIHDRGDNYSARNKEATSKKTRRCSSKLETSPFTRGTFFSINGTEKERVCYKCSFSSEDKSAFKEHITTHKTSPSDLQCPFCGMCFIVHPPLEKHLLVQHNVKNGWDFMKTHGLGASEEYENKKEPEIEPEKQRSEEELAENQCKVCQIKFDSALLLEKHFRVHGGAFLLASLRAKKT